ncbi:MAG TPA: hypothetical protein VEA36_01320 [Candidatus Paceibacterota bacterium]|nr:hypothetical protein [Candidatus Paceibacterota bacterium]
MQFIAIAVIGIFFLPASVGAPAHAQVTSAPAVATAAEDEPSPTKVALEKRATQSYTVSMTAYNAVPAQTDADPFITASGAWTNPEIVAARSQDLAAELPFGTVIKVERAAADSPRCQFGAVEHLIGYRVIADTMHSRWTKKIDILLDQTDTVPVAGAEMNPAKAVGVCGGVTITVVGKIDIKEMPATQEELREMFETPALART